MINKIFNKLNSKVNKLFRSTYVSVLKLTGKSDYKRWSKLETLLDSWDERTKILASFITPNSAVLEFGAGRQVLKSFLPEGCSYYHSDIVMRDEKTLVIDLNEELPELPKVNYVVFSGVLEYVKDIEGVLKHCLKYSDTILFSYATLESFSNLTNRRVSGWISDLSEKEILQISSRNSHTCEVLTVWKNQTLYKYSKKQNSFHYS